NQSPINARESPSTENRYLAGSVASHRVVKSPETSPVRRRPAPPTADASPSETRASRAKSNAVAGGGRSKAAELNGRGEFRPATRGLPRSANPQDTNSVFAQSGAWS